jgi:flagellar assembly protein FliH
MNARTTPRVDDIVDLLASAAIDLAEVVVGREVRDAEGRGLTALRRALASAPEHEDVVVRLHPADLAAVTSGDVTALLAERAGAAVDLVSDTGVLPGDAVAEFPGGSVDARVATALTRMRTALRGAPRSGEEA